MKRALLVAITIALLVCVANLYAGGDFSSSAVGSKTTSVSSAVRETFQSEATTVSTTVMSTTQETTTTVTSTTQKQTTTAPSTTRAPAKTEPVTQAVVPENVNYGTAGRLYVPQVGISVALYYYEITDENLQVAQAVTDRRDSATCGYDYGVFVISDHRTQEFGRLLNVTNGDTAYIAYPDGSQVNMVCVSCFDGYNAGYDLLRLDGSSAVQGAPCDVIMRTCLDSHGGLRITYWCYY